MLELFNIESNGRGKYKYPFYLKPYYICIRNFEQLNILKVSRLAIGVEGGFDVDTKKYEYEEQNSIVLLPGFHQFKIGKLSKSIWFHRYIINVII